MTHLRLMMASPAMPARPAGTVMASSAATSTTVLKIRVDLQQQAHVLIRGPTHMHAPAALATRLAAGPVLRSFRAKTLKGTRVIPTPRVIMMDQASTAVPAMPGTAETAQRATTPTGVRPVRASIMRR